VFIDILLCAKSDQSNVPFRDIKNVPFHSLDSSLIYIDEQPINLYYFCFE
jgi:hypothetical protein